MPSRFRRLSGVGVVITSLALDWCSGMVCHGFQAQKRGSWIPGKECAERVLASAILIDGRKEWTCKFCSESNVWARWRWRCCDNDIPAGLRGKYRQAVAARSGEWSTGSATSSGEEDRRPEVWKRRTRNSEQGLMLWKRGEGNEGRVSLPGKKETWKMWRKDMDIEDETESGKKLGRWSKGGNDLMPEHQKVQKRSQKIQGIKDKRRNMKKENAAAQEEMQNIREGNDRNDERFRQLSNEVDKNKMADAEMAAQLQSLQAGEERRGSNASQTGDCCLEEMLQRVVALGTNVVDVFFQRVRRETVAAQGQMAGREEGTRNSEDEQEQGRISQQLVLPAPGGINEGTPASLELDLPRVRGALGECGGAGKSRTMGGRKRGLSSSPSRRPMEEGALAGDL